MKKFKILTTVTSLIAASAMMIGTAPMAYANAYQNGRTSTRTASHILGGNMVGRTKYRVSIGEQTNQAITVRNKLKAGWGGRECRNQKFWGAYKATGTYSGRDSFIDSFNYGGVQMIVKAMGNWDSGSYPFGSDSDWSDYLQHAPGNVQAMINSGQNSSWSSGCMYKDGDKKNPPPERKDLGGYATFKEQLDFDKFELASESVLTQHTISPEYIQLNNYIQGTDGYPYGIAYDKEDKPSDGHVDNRNERINKEDRGGNVVITPFGELLDRIFQSRAGNMQDRFYKYKQLYQKVGNPAGSVEETNRLLAQLQAEAEQATARTKRIHTSITPPPDHKINEMLAKGGIEKIVRVGKKQSINYPSAVKNFYWRRVHHTFTKVKRCDEIRVPVTNDKGKVIGKKPAWSSKGLESPHLKLGDRVDNTNVKVGVNANGWRIVSDCPEFGKEAEQGNGPAHEAREEGTPSRGGWNFAGHEPSSVAQYESRAGVDIREDGENSYYSYRKEHNLPNLVAHLSRMSNHVRSENGDDDNEISTSYWDADSTCDINKDSENFLNSHPKLGLEFKLEKLVDNMNYSLDKLTVWYNADFNRKYNKNHLTDEQREALNDKDYVNRYTKSLHTAADDEDFKRYIGRLYYTSDEYGYKVYDLDYSNAQSLNLDSNDSKYLGDLKQVVDSGSSKVSHAVFLTGCWVEVMNAAQVTYNKQSFTPILHYYILNIMCNKKDYENYRSHYPEFGFDGPYQEKNNDSSNRFEASMQSPIFYDKGRTTGKGVFPRMAELLAEKNQLPGWVAGYDFDSILNGKEERKSVLDLYSDNYTGEKDPVYSKECPFDCVNQGTGNEEMKNNIGTYFHPFGNGTLKRQGILETPTDTKGNLAKSSKNSADMTFFRNNYWNTFRPDIWTPQNEYSITYEDAHGKKNAKRTVIIRNDAPTPWKDPITAELQGSYDNVKFFDILNGRLGATKDIIDPQTSPSSSIVGRYGKPVSNVSTGAITAVVNGQVNHFRIRAPWASEPDKPIRLNIRWEYDTKNAGIVIKTFGGVYESVDEGNPILTSKQIISDGKCDMTVTGGYKPTDEKNYKYTGAQTVDAVDSKLDGADDFARALLIRFVRASAE